MWVCIVLKGPETSQINFKFSLSLNHCRAEFFKASCHFGGILENILKIKFHGKKEH